MLVEVYVPLLMAPAHVLMLMVTRTPRATDMALLATEVTVVSSAQALLLAVVLAPQRATETVYVTRVHSSAAATRVGREETALSGLVPRV